MSDYHERMLARKLVDPEFREHYDRSVRRIRRRAFWNGFLGFFWPPLLRYGPHIFDRRSKRRLRRIAREAVVRCYGVPYLRELSRDEAAGMALLEARGEVVRDGGLSGELHWHRRTTGRQNPKEREP